MACPQERTFIAIKPDGVQRGLIGEIIKRFEAKGFKLVGMKLMSVSLDAAVTFVTAAMSSGSTTKNGQ